VGYLEIESEAPRPGLGGRHEDRFEPTYQRNEGTFEVGKDYWERENENEGVT